MAVGSRQRVLLASGVAAALLLALAAVAWWWLTLDLPPARALSPGSLASVRVTDRHGTLLQEVLSRPDGRCTWVGLDRISPHLVQATLAGEDRRFFEHGGVDLLALARSLALLALRGHVVSGGSTLTMQLARLLCSPQQMQRTLAGKLRQMVLARRLERVLTKEQILWQYLNRAPYGNGTFGIEAAARRYLSKPASQLSLAEAALLSALPRSPSGYSPFSHPRRLLSRQRHILALMRAQGRISEAQYRLSRREPIDWQAARRPFLAPHLVRQVLALPRLSRARSIRTTLDLPLQQKVKSAVRRTISRLAQKGVSNAAVLVVRSATGEVLAHVGSADFFSEKHAGQVDGSASLRQPGSTMKPFTYALALEQGLTPATLLRDLPVHFATDEGDYAPVNYDGTYHGPVRLRVALGSSYNVPAVRVARFVGIDRLLSRLRALGFSSLTRTGRHYGLGLTLGNGEVTLQELVAGYATLARGGSYLPLRWVLQARTVSGAALPLPRPAARRVLEREVTRLVSHILADPLARLPAFGRGTPLDLGFTAAVKTGTSKDFRDNWTVGYTSEVTVGVWVGNFDGSAMHNVSGITGAGPLWAEVMMLATEGKGRARALSDIRAGLDSRRICPLSGELAGEHCPSSAEELFVPGTGPARACTFHRKLALDRRNGLLAGPACPERLVVHKVLLEYPPVYRAWALARGIETVPTDWSPLCPGPAPGLARGPARPDVRISFPVHGDRYFVDPDLRRPFQSLPLEAAVSGAAREVRWLVDGELFARSSFPYSARWPIITGRHTIVAELPDGTRSQPVTVTVR